MFHLSEFCMPLQAIRASGGAPLGKADDSYLHLKSNACFASIRDHRNVSSCVSKSVSEIVMPKSVRSLLGVGQSFTGVTGVLKNHKHLEYNGLYVRFRPSPPRSESEAFFSCSSD